jgi:Skp family chaperone for outer membrane proteins
MTRKTEWPLITAVGGLLAALLVCICLLAFPVYNNKTGQLELEVTKQDYQRQLQNLDRKYESKINNLQEQLTALQFISNKKTDLLDDDVKRTRRDIDDVRERLKPRTK